MVYSFFQRVMAVQNINILQNQRLLKIDTHLVLHFLGDCTKNRNAIKNVDKKIEK